jgi:hypothetical protein
MIEMRFALSPLLAAALVASMAAGLADERAAQAQGRPAKAGEREVAARTVQAMESFDLLEFEAARRQLGEAITMARKSKLDREPILARVYLNLGIVEFAGMKNRDGARRAFAAAVEIDPTIEIGVAYRTDAMAELLAAVKKEVSAAATRTEPAEGGDGCGQIEGVEHAAVQQGRRGQPMPIAARVGDAVGAEGMSLFFRPTGARAFTEVKMNRAGGCAYEAAIPADAMQGEALQYYVAAMRRGQMVSGSGSRTSPNILELIAGGDGENPLGGAAGVSKGAAPAGGEKTFFVSLSVGTGGGYVTGQTEVVGTDVNCCFAPALVHLFPEVGYYFSRRVSLSAAFRMGFALGADVQGHATAAPAGLLRFRFAPSETGEGLLVSAAAGGGIIRHTVKVEEQMGGADTDTTASGPFILGAGLGYLKSLSGAMRLVAELNVLAAFPGGIKEVGPCPGSGCVRPNFGLQGDINLGVLFAF